MLRGLAITLVIAGLSLFAFSAWQLVDRERHQDLEQEQLQAALEAARPPTRASGSAAAAAGARARAGRGDSWGRLEVARLGLSVTLDEGIDARTLRRAVGHLPGTAFPGEEGNVVLAGHRDGLFRPLREVREGDTLRLATTDGVFDYRVGSVQVVDPDRTDVIQPSAGRQEVTLVTCYPFYYVGPAPRRFIVRAQREGAGGLARTSEGGEAGPPRLAPPP